MTSAPPAAATALVSSSESSSTTSNSSAGRVWTASAASKPGRRPASFRAGTTTDTRRSGAALEAGGSRGTRQSSSHPMIQATARSDTSNSGLTPVVLRRPPSGCRGSLRRMDFEFTARSLELQKQLRDFIDTHVVPAEAGVPAAGGGVGRPPLPPAGHGGPEGRGAPARPVEPVPSRTTEVGRGPHERRLRAAVRDDGPQPAHGRGDELRRARHRQHGDPRRVRHAGAAGRVARPAARAARSGRASR